MTPTLQAGTYQDLFSFVHPSKHQCENGKVAEKKPSHLKLLGAGKAVQETCRLSVLLSPVYSVLLCTYLPGHFSVIAMLTE